MIFINAGHGGIEPSTGNYTTAPNKQWFHQGQKFHQDGAIFEGVLNRALAAKLEEKLMTMRVPYQKVYHNHIDTHIRWRTQIANNYAKARPKEAHLWVSFHNNASPTHTARGTEVYTSPGQTKSDIYATAYMDSVKENLIPELFTTKFRADYFTDLDPDREARFAELMWTNIPAILLECLFFDQIDDAKLIFQDEVQDVFAQSVIDALIKTNYIK
jgi:N-acetylmuramoyl-L-alanine amidase